MLKLYPQLLNSAVTDSVLSSTFKTHGSYNPMQFVLRLSKEIQQELARNDSNLNRNAIHTEKQVQAFSTYLHETIHWWQHVGSNFGLMTSMKYPVQAHAVFNDLRAVLDIVGPFKSILEYDNISRARKSIVSNHINRILNYWYDLESAGDIAFKPAIINEYFKEYRFASVGHSYHMLWASAIRTISTIVNLNIELLPKVDEWSEPFKALEKNKVPGFDPEPQSIQMPPIGTQAIFEGQARFSQIQYLYFASGGKLTMNDFAEARLLDGIYVEAFNIFLNIVEEEMPKMADDSVIGLFLLVCDIAINPSDGFPFNIYHYESFVHSVDPGWRFILICNKIRRNTELKKSIINYTKEEYIEVGEILSQAIACISPYRSIEFMNSVVSQEQTVSDLLTEENKFKYKSENMPVRLFFSKYLRFQQDKLKYPQFFCWPGVCMTENVFNTLSLGIAETLFHCHEALYVNDVNNIVQFTISEKYPIDNMKETFNDFFAWNCSYDMVRQWIIKDGPFSYDLEWLTTNYPDDMAKQWADRTFEQIFKVNPDEFKILLFEE